jgi:hypothetical protein
MIYYLLNLLNLLKSQKVIKSLKFKNQTLAKLPVV